MRTGKVDARRNYLPLDQLEENGATVLLLGISPFTMRLADRPWLSRLEAVAEGGNRVAIGIRSKSNETVTRDKKSDQAELGKRWGVFIRSSNGKEAFEPGRQWRNEGGGIWTRQFGRGEVVLVTSSERLSNESLATDTGARESALRVAGGRRLVVFDETHLGNSERGSIAALARRYHLGGLCAGLLLLSTMFIWRGTTAFPPPEDKETQDEDAIGARDPREMMTTLLTRHVRPQGLTEACVAEWNRVRPHRRLEMPEWAGREPVEAFGKIRDRLGKTRQMREGARAE